MAEESKDCSPKALKIETEKTNGVFYTDRAKVTADNGKVVTAEAGSEASAVSKAARQAGIKK